MKTISPGVLRKYILMKIVKFYLLSCNLEGYILLLKYFYSTSRVFSSHQIFQNFAHKLAFKNTVVIGIFIIKNEGERERVRVWITIYSLKCVTDLTSLVNAWNPHLCTQELDFDQKLLQHQFHVPTKRKTVPMLKIHN